MLELTTTANLVEPSALDNTDLLVATIERSELEAMLAPQVSPQLWFELGVEGEGARRLTVDLTDADLRALLEGTSGDDIALALDGVALTDLVEEPDVEAHGMRTALAIAVVAATAAVAAPTAIGATQQGVGAAAKQQGVGTAATTQVSSEIVRSAIARGSSKSSVARSSALTFGKLSILRAGVVR